MKADDDDMDPALEAMHHLHGLLDGKGDELMRAKHSPKHHSVHVAVAVTPHHPGEHEEPDGDEATGLTKAMLDSLGGDKDEKKGD